MMPSLSKQPPTGIDHWQDSMINIVYNACSVVTMPLELGLRPFHGTRYFPPLVMFCSSLMMLFIPLFFSVAGAVGHMIPFMQVPAQMGMIGMWGLSKLFFLGCFIQGFRKWRLMLNLARERNSMYEGPPLFFFTWIPKATFWKIRILFEPLFLIILSSVLPNLFILEPGAGTFLFISGIFLAMKNYTGWYMQWQFLRELMDMKSRAPVIAAMVENRETEDELASINLAGFPKDLDPDIRKSFVAHIARVFSVDDKERGE
jgi:hypothetical protein